MDPMDISAVILQTENCLSIINLQCPEICAILKHRFVFYYIIFANAITYSKMSRPKKNYNT